MGQLIADVSNDPALNATASSTEQHLCAGEPADRAAVIAQSLGSNAMSAPDYTLQDAAGGGRELVMAQKANITVASSGTGDHVALIDATDMHVVTTCPPVAVTAGNEYTVNSWTRTLPDP